MTCTEQSFLKDVAKHDISVIRDKGVNRHIRFGVQGSYHMHFDLITWPGHLCYTGDMGTYVFCRLEDMFEFFRADREQLHRGDQTLAINTCYWAEKLVAIDRNGGLREYSEQRFRQHIQEWLDNAEADDDVRRAVAEEVLSHADEGEHEAMSAAIRFEHRGFSFRDLWEANVTEYTYRFLWCCYAIAWGIQQYDKTQNNKLTVTWPEAKTGDERP